MTKLNRRRVRKDTFRCTSIYESQGEYCHFALVVRIRNSGPKHRLAPAGYYLERAVSLRNKFDKRIISYGHFVLVNVSRIFLGNKNDSRNLYTSFSGLFNYSPRILPKGNYLFFAGRIKGYIFALIFLVGHQSFRHFLFLHNDPHNYIVRNGFVNCQANNFFRFYKMPIFAVVSEIFSKSAHKSQQRFPYHQFHHTPTEAILQAQTIPQNIRPKGPNCCKVSPLLVKYNAWNGSW